MIGLLILRWYRRQRLRAWCLRRRWPAIVGILRGRQVAYRVHVIDGTLTFDDEHGGTAVVMACRIERSPGAGIRFTRAVLEEDRR